MAVFVDSSVWIAAQRAESKEAVRLKQMIASNDLLCITRLVQVEVCQGARTEALLHKLWDGFLGFQFLEVDERHWALSAWNYFKCRKAGFTLSTIDCLNATLVREYHVPLWTLDKTFKDIQPIIGLELFS